MNLLETMLNEAPAGGRRRAPRLMTHVVIGYPSFKESLDIVRAMADGGASLIELQIPFSDPMADGPTIMWANEQALLGGTTPTDCMRAMETLSKELSVPLLFMSYFNLIFNYRNGGLRRTASSNGRHPALDAAGNVAGFCRDASAAGAQGLIIPDVPPEENSEGYWDQTREHGLLPIPLVSPVSSERRMKLIASKAEGGFVYCVSTTGTTGARAALPPGLAAYLKTVRRIFKRPLAVGFGISTPEHVRKVAPHAEIAIVGSAMIDRIGAVAPKRRLAEIRRFTEELAHPA